MPRNKMSNVQRAFAVRQGQILHRHRSVLGLTQAQLAQVLGVTLNMVGRYERGEHSMPTDKILRLAELAQDLGEELKTSRLEEVAAELGVKIDSLGTQDEPVLDKLSDLLDQLRHRVDVRRAAIGKHRRKPRGRG